jgi:hypothetical protein
VLEKKKPDDDPQHAQKARRPAPADVFDSGQVDSLLKFVGPTLHDIDRNRALVRGPENGGPTATLPEAGALREVLLAQAERRIAAVGLVTPFV